MISKAQIKYIHSLRHKKYRQQSGRFSVEGVKIVDELLREHYIRMDGIFALESWIRQSAGILEAHPEITITPVSVPELKQLSALDTPQEVLAVCEIPPDGDLPGLGGTITLALESVRDPGNLGTIIRIADWFGLGRIICSPDCADPFNHKTIQATMGSIARVRVTETPLAEVLKENSTVPVFAAVLGGEDFRHYTGIPEGILVIGNESRGLSAAILEQATHRVTIPRVGRAESLNAAVAAGILLSRLVP